MITKKEKPIPVSAYATRTPLQPLRCSLWKKVLKGGIIVRNAVGFRAGWTCI